MTDVTELDIDDFKDEKDWDYIRPLDLIITTKPDEDGLYDVFYRKGEDDGILCSEVDDEQMEDGEIADIADIMYPFFHNLKHKREVVPVEANFLVGYVGENIKKKDTTIFAFPLFWNGTINVGDRSAVRLPAGSVGSYSWKERITSFTPDVEDLRSDIDIDLTKPVGRYIIELDLGGEEVDIDEYTLEDRQSVINSFRNDDSYKLKFNKGTDVFKIIDKVFLKPQEQSNQEGVVTLYTEAGERSLRDNRKTFLGIYEALKDRIRKLQKKPTIRSKDLSELKTLFDSFTYEEIEDEHNDFSVKDKQMRKGVKRLVLSLYEKYKKQKEPLPTIQEETPVAEPQPIADAIATPMPDREQELLSQLDNLKKLLGDAIQAYNSSKTIQNSRNIIKYRRESEEVAKMLKEERERKGKGIVDNPELYEKAKQIADEKYKKPSAYKSGFIIKKYKELGGTYSGDKPKTTGIARWFKEEWKDVGNKEYPVYRPTKRVTIETPLTPEEIKPSNLMKQIKLKQEIKGDANLPPFEKKGTGKVIPVGIALDKISQYDEIWKYSNPKKVAEMAEKYLGKDDAKFVFRSSKPNKKYMVYDKKNEKWVYFGEMGYEDFTKHQDEKRRKNYLTRTANMKGDWKDNKYSANNLSRNILW